MMMMMMMMIEFGQGTEIVTRAAQFMELSMKKDEWAYTPSGNSLGLLHSLLLVSLSAVPDCID